MYGTSILSYTILWFCPQSGWAADDWLATGDCPSQGEPGKRYNA